MAEDPVVMALRAALSSSEQAAIRVALGERLLTLGRAADALAELEAGLQHDPTDVAVLGAADVAAPADLDLEETDVAHAFEVWSHGVGVEPERLGDVGGGERPR